MRKEEKGKAKEKRKDKQTGMPASQDLGWVL